MKLDDFLIQLVKYCNWAGYILNGQVGSVTNVKGSWIIPEVAPSMQNQVSLVWVGIDNITFEQIGTESDVINGASVYYAWYEFYPEPTIIIKSMQVAPGDIILAEVNYSNGQFTVYIKDVTTEKYFSTSTKVSSAKRNSAEWIVEIPVSDSGILPSLANFGKAYFGQDYTGIPSNSATISGVTGNINSFWSSAYSINMSSSGTIKAQTSPLSADGTSFSVDWVSAGP